MSSCEGTSFRKPRTATGHEEIKGLSSLVLDLKRCTKTKNLNRGKELHALAIAANFHRNRYVASALITMYSRCRRMELARHAFEGVIHRNVVSWNSLLFGYVENGNFSEALELFTGMDCEPSSVTYIALLKACAFGCSVNKGTAQMQVYVAKGAAFHRQVCSLGLEADMIVANTLIHMYGAFGMMATAQDVFDRMDSKDIVSWNSLLQGYVENGDGFTAIKLFSSMNCEPSSVTYLAVLKACARLASESSSDRKTWLHKGIELHNDVRTRGFDSDILVTTTLMDMYCKCGDMHLAREVFDKMIRKDVQAWSCLLHGYVENGEHSTALELFSSMEECQPNSFTYVAAVKACTGLAKAERDVSAEKGMEVHEQIKQRRLDRDVAVANALLDFYSKLGDMHRARAVFDRMHQRDAITWNSLLLGYVDAGESSAALDLFTNMDCKPTPVTYMAALRACGCLTELRAGQGIHGTVCRLGLDRDTLVAHSLIDFYCRCSCMDAAVGLFYTVDSPGLVSWSVLLAGYSSVGDPVEVFRLIGQMEDAGVQLDAVSFTSILSVCSHSGRVEQGKKWFDLMMRVGVSPSVEHYNCLVDMLGRANRLEEAVSVIENMPVEANSVTWNTLLANSRRYGLSRFQAFDE